MKRRANLKVLNRRYGFAIYFRGKLMMKCRSWDDVEAFKNGWYNH